MLILSRDESSLQVASNRGKRRKVVESPPPDESPDETAALPYTAPEPAPLPVDGGAHAAREAQLRQRAPEFKSAAVRELSTLLTSALNEAFSQDSNLQLVQCAPTMHMHLHVQSLYLHVTLGTTTTPRRATGAHPQLQ